MKRLTYQLTLQAEFDVDEERLYADGLTVEDTVELDRESFETNPTEFVTLFPNATGRFSARMAETRPQLQVVNCFDQQALF